MGFWSNLLGGGEPKIDTANDDMAAEGSGKELPDPETFPEGFDNANPFSRLGFDGTNALNSFLTDEFEGQFYRNNSPYGKSTLIEVDPPETK